jgi:peptidoglycan hydrolase-like protein with peptidoglycan-binding domain
MSMRCHFDADGWLQGPIVITHMLTPNRYDSGFADKARGLVQHTEDGFEGGTVATFMSPASQASAFFSVAEDGIAHQYLPVGHGYVAWAEAAGNPFWRSCECEDLTRTGDPMTQPQLVAFAQILEACSAYDGFPLVITDDVNGTGLITHGDGGAAWGGHFQCPGDVRKAQRPQIIALAIAIRSGGAPASDWQEAIMNKLPTLQQGDTDKAGEVFFVHRMQALVQVYGRINDIADAACITADGAFGPAVKVAVEQVQASRKLAADGICGPQTWGVLIAGSA